MRKPALVIVGFLLLFAVVVPWVVAYQSSCSVTHGYGRLNGRQIDCVAVDGTHFDRYLCLIFDGSAGHRVFPGERDILLDGRPVEFPYGENVGFLHSDGRIEFTAISQADIESESYRGSSEIYYLLGRLPSQKQIAFGVPREEFVRRKFLGPE